MHAGACRAGRGTNAGLDAGPVRWLPPAVTDDGIGANRQAGRYGQSCPQLTHGCSRRPLFRPPFGAFDRATRLAAHACHLTAVVEWTATVNDGHLVAVGGRLHRGYIILMHFRPSLLRDLTAALKAIRRAHLTIGRLSSSLESRT